MIDQLGREVKVGDYVVWPVSAVAVAGVRIPIHMKYGKVSSTDEGLIRVQNISVLNKATVPSLQLHVVRCKSILIVPHSTFVT